jgi:hypothetical protein
MLIYGVDAFVDIDDACSVWAMEPQLRVQVVEDEIVVSVPGFRYSATYYKPHDARQLVARNVPTPDDLRTTMRRSEFLVEANSGHTLLRNF